MLVHHNYQNCQTKLLPSDWLTANVTPIFKKGARSSPNNYRPVSLTSVSCKLLEHIFYSQIVTHLDENNFFSAAQHGFLKGRSCETQLLNTSRDFATSLNCKGQTDAIVLDFKKAFDSVPHSRLLSKLSSLNLPPSTVSWIRSFLSGRTQRVTVNGYHSAISPVTSGVPQGSVLGPLLFLIYINDLPRGIQSTVRLFADDCLIYRDINSPSDQLILQSDLDRLQEWSNIWLLKFNLDKCNSIRVTNRRNQYIFPYELQGKTLETVSSFTYLGLLFSNNMSWNTHINNICSKAKRQVHLLRRNLKGASVHTKKLAYITYVRPIVEYASTVWSPTSKENISRLDSVQRLAVRFIRGNFSPYASVTEMSTGLGLDSLQERRQVSDVCMAYKIMHGGICLEADTFFTPSTARRATRGHQQKLLIPSSAITVHQQSFSCRAAKSWNALSPSAVEAMNLPSFKARVTQPISSNH